MIEVYKIGGSVIEDSAMLETFCREFASLTGPRILVHGGGVMASGLQKALGQTPVKINGRRVTDAETLKAVTMVYAGWCNKILVATLQKYGCDAIGLSGCDADIIRAEKRPPMLQDDGSTVDFGFVGDVSKSSINVPVLEKMLEAGLVPVLSPVNHDGAGQLFNTNADTVAASVAAALGAKLVCCFELDGVLADINEPSSVIKVISEKDFSGMKSSGQVSEGMIPKIENCIRALKDGACSAVIGNALKIKEDTGTEITL